MDYIEQLPQQRFTRAKMLQRVARYSKLKGYDGGLPDSYMPGCERILYNVIGFQPPKDEQSGIQSPVGAQAARLAAIKITEGFNLGYCRALPGRGPMMHNHDTNETFIPMTGLWRASWENEKGKVESVDLKPLDVISFPPGAIRRFENVTKGPKNKYSVLMFVIGGDEPRAEFTTVAMRTLQSAGVIDEQLNIRPAKLRMSKPVGTKSAAVQSSKAKSTKGQSPKPGSARTAAGKSSTTQSRRK